MIIRVSDFDTYKDYYTELYRQYLFYFERIARIFLRHEKYKNIELWTYTPSLSNYDRCNSYPTFYIVSLGIENEIFFRKYGYKDPRLTFGKII